MERLHGMRPLSENYPQFAGRLPPHAAVMGRPNFKLAGLAIGNGLTDPETQVVALSSIPHPSLVDVLLKYANCNCERSKDATYNF